jgi:hypothetical protein
MRFPEAILLPVLMLADYLLTVAGATARERGYADHFKLEQYELNPTWQQDVARKRWFNPRHLLAMTLVSGIVTLVLEGGLLPREMAAVLLGALLTVYGAIVGRHVNNLLLFHHVAHRKHDVTGAVTMTHAFALSSSLYQIVMVFVPVAILAAVTLNPWVIGAMMGFGSLAIAHLAWMKHPRRRSASS